MRFVIKNQSFTVNNSFFSLFLNLLYLGENHTTIHFRKESREARTETKLTSFNSLITTSRGIDRVINDKKSLFSVLKKCTGAV